MLKKIALLIFAMSVVSTTVLFSDDDQEEISSEKHRSMSIVIQHCTS
jgi:hypothetical protein